MWIGIIIIILGIFAPSIVDGRVGCGSLMYGLFLFVLFFGRFLF